MSPPQKKKKLQHENCRFVSVGKMLDMLSLHLLDCICRQFNHTVCGSKVKQKVIIAFTTYLHL